MIFPTDNIWRASQNGDKFGHIIASKNISLKRGGYLSLARKAMVLYSLADDAGFGNPLAIVSDDRYLYVLTVGHFYVIDTTADTFSILEANATNQPTFDTCSDAIIFNTKVIASGTSTINAISFGQGQTWPSPNKVTGLSSSYPHPLVVIEHLNQFAVGNGNTVLSYDTSYANQATLTLPAQYIVTSLRWRQNSIYIGTRHMYGGNAKVFVWDGSSTSASAAYTVRGSDWVYSMTEYLGSLVIVASSGQILRFNGSDFDELAVFPVHNTEYAWNSGAANTSLVGKVASRGMEAVGKRLYINIDGSLNNGAGVGMGTYLPDQPSGLWCLDSDHGLYHEAGANYLTKLKLTVSSLDSSYLSFATAHQALTGDAVLCAGLSGVTGATAGQVYYAIVDSNAGVTTCRLALSAADAYAGKYVALGGTPASGDKFIFDRYESFGQTVINQPGGICVTRRARLSNFYNSEVMFGLETLDASLAAKGVLMSLGMGRNRGYFVTPKIFSANVLDAFTKLYLFFRQMNLDTDKIVVKYRIRERFGVPTPLCFTGSATWASATTFTIDTTKKDIKSVEVGDEIEIVKGAGAGYLAHITAIDDSSSTYTITIDETMPVSSGSFDFIAADWKKLATFTNSSENNPRGYTSKTTDASDTRWIQFKIEIQGRGRDIDALGLVRAVKQEL